jgi:hypothetical protein
VSLGNGAVLGSLARLLGGFGVLLPKGVALGHHLGQP